MFVRLLKDTPSAPRGQPTARGSLLPHRPENLAMRQEVIEVQRGPSGAFTATPVPVRPLPDDDSWYENTWRDWRDGAVYR